MVQKYFSKFIHSKDSLSSSLYYSFISSTYIAIESWDIANRGRYIGSTDCLVSGIAL